MRNRLAAIGAALVMVGALPAVARAQSNVESNAGIQFDFLSPGARSLALGGAFTAVADDATAAFANPAGLKGFAKMEFSFEARVRRFDTPFTNSGHAFGNPTGIGTDTVAGIVDGKSKETLGSPSFLSFVYPREKFKIAGYRHELARFRSNITTEGAYYGAPVVPGIPTARLLPVIGDLDLTVVDYGVAGSYNLNPQVTIGAGLVIYDLEIDSTTTRYQLLGNNDRPATYDTVAETQFQAGSGNKVGVNIGVTVEPSSVVRFGAVFRKGASFDVDVRETNAAGTPTESDTGRFNVPDVYSLGVRVAPTSALSFSADYTRVQYSQLTEGLVPIVVLLVPSVASDYSVDDGNEAHFGVQYLNANAKAPFALRGGLWYDPAHSPVYNGADLGLQTLFRERDISRMHYAFGAGFGVPRLGIEVHAGVDLSKLVNTTSVSTLIRF